MNNQAPIFAALFPFVFVGMWLAITTVLSVMSGWRSLMRWYPDQAEPPLVSLRMQSGVMGRRVNLNGILTLSACRSGLRVAIWKIFGPFEKPFFVPWNEIAAETKSAFLGEQTRLTFGAPPVGRLTISAPVWSRLCASIPTRPAGLESGPPLSNEALANGLLLQWAAFSALGAAFFTLAPRLLSPGAPTAPIAITIGLPVVATGVSQLVRYVILRRRE